MNIKGRFNGTYHGSYLDRSSLGRFSCRWHKGSDVDSRQYCQRDVARALDEPSRAPRLFPRKEDSGTRPGSCHGERPGHPWPSSAVSHVRQGRTDEDFAFRAEDSKGI